MQVKWIDGGMSFLAETGSNHAFVMDGAPEAGGRNLAPRPMEMLLAGTGGCTTFDVVEILKKGRQAITGCAVSLQAKRAKTEPKVFTRIHFHFRIGGKRHNIIERQVAQLRSCSARWPQSPTIWRSSKTNALAKR